MPLAATGAPRAGPPNCRRASGSPEELQTPYAAPHRPRQPRTRAGLWALVGPLAQHGVGARARAEPGRAVGAAGRVAARADRPAAPPVRGGHRGGESHLPSCLQGHPLPAPQRGDFRARLGSQLPGRPSGHHAEDLDSLRRHGSPSMLPPSAIARAVIERRSMASISPQAVRSAARISGAASSFQGRDEPRQTGGDRLRERDRRHPLPPFSEAFWPAPAGREEAGASLGSLARPRRSGIARLATS